LTLIVVKYAATFHAAGDAQRVRRLSQILLKWTTAAAALPFVLGLLLAGSISAFLHIPNDGAVPLTTTILALSLIVPSVRGILQGQQDFVRYGISLVLESLLKVVFAVALVYSGFGAPGAMLGWMLGTSIALAYTIWAVLRKHGAAADASVRLALDMRRLRQTVLGIGLASGVLIVLSFMDVLMVKHFFSAHEAGLYAAVNLTGKVVLFLGAFVPAVILPKAVAKRLAGENSTGLLVQAVAVTLGLSGIALVIFSLMPVEVVRVLAGHQFVAAAPYVMQYDAAMCLLAVVTLAVNYRIGIHRFEFLPWLGAVLVCEITAIAVWHTTLWDVVHVLLGGHAAAVAVCLFGRRD
jgi:O-antigen/teichoic acid export membrane protein